jgi:serine/threonine protein kinase
MYKNEGRGKHHSGTQNFRGCHSSICLVFIAFRLTSCLSFSISCNKELFNSLSTKCLFLYFSNLRFAFQDDENLFMVLDLMLGGDMRFHMERLGPFSEDMVRFYMAELSCGISFLHAAGVVHRDLKPDNGITFITIAHKLLTAAICLIVNSKFYSCLSLSSAIG